ncbi:isoprenylcysteine carboxylmethyltransferase family protein [Candidatus Bathyarchaeota archaeon]|nr:MAG: isoprenylcysteine carboxylmethyltransferase family protein [Candidatus Bathyarchaeota archaeon]
MRKILIGHIAYITLYLSLILLTTLFYNSANLQIMLYAGWLLLVLGAIILFASVKSRKKGYVTEKGIKKEILVDTGIYAYVRHPEYLGHMLIIFSLIFMAQYWINIVVGSTLIALLFFAIMEEEKRNIRKFGEAYKNYMKNVPRMNLFAGIFKQLTRKREDRYER